MNAIEAEPTYPSAVEVRDFDFVANAVTENRSPLNRGIDLFRRSAADQRQDEIGREVAAVISKQTAKKLDKTGLNAVRIPRDSDISMEGNFLLVTGRLLDVDEGNRLTRVAIGLGAGESRLDTEVHVFRVVNGERAEVLAFTTHADAANAWSCRPRWAFGELLLGPIALITGVEVQFLSGQEIYLSPDRLPGKPNSDQIARYLYAVRCSRRIDSPGQGEASAFRQLASRLRRRHVTGSITR